MGNPYDYLALNLTNRCNTFCKYCFQNAKKSDYDYIGFNDAKKIIDYCYERSTGQKILHLTGGEPTLNKDFFKIADYAVGKGYVVRIQSNGMLWTQFSVEEMQLLSQPNVSIKISLDGWNAKTHEYLRAKESFNLVLEGIQRIKEYSRMIGLKTCVHSRNIDELDEMVFFADSLGVQGLSYNMIRDEGAALANVSQEDLTIPEIEVAKKLIPIFNDPKYQYLMNGNNLLLFYYTTGDIAYQKHFYVDYDGSVYPHQSCLKNELMGNVFKDGMSALNDELAKKNGHYHFVDHATVEYVKANFIPMKKHQVN